MTPTRKRIDLDASTDLRAVIDAVHADGVPRLIALDGKEVAMIVAPADYPHEALRGLPPQLINQRRKRDLKSFAGIWHDLDAERLIDYVREGRHASPPSPAVTL